MFCAKLGVVSRTLLSGRYVLVSQREDETIRKDWTWANSRRRLGPSKSPEQVPRSWKATGGLLNQQRKGRRKLKISQEVRKEISYMVN